MEQIALSVEMFLGCVIREQCERHFNIFTNKGGGRSIEETENRVLNRLQVHPIENLKAKHFGVHCRAKDGENDKDTAEETPNNICWSRTYGESVVLDLAREKERK